MKIKSKFCLSMFLYAVTAIVILFATGTKRTEAAYTNYSDDTYYCWINDDNTVEIRQYKGNAEKVIIPSEIDGKKVVAIDGAFRLNKTLKEVVIPDTVTELRSTFEACPLLEKVTLSTSIYSMYRAFDYCTSLKTITIPASYSKAFDYNGGNDENFVGSGLKSVVFENGTTSIHAHMFDGCEYLETVTVPDTVTIIGNYAFGDCVKLVMDLPKNLEHLGYHAFYDCKSITKLTIPKSLTKVPSGGAYGYFEGTNLKQVTIEEGATMIVENLFKGCTQIAEINLPESVVEIGNTAFYGCTGMKTLRLYDSVKTIGSDPFHYNFPNIENIYLTASNIGQTLELGGLLGTGTNKHTFASDNKKVVTINSDKAVITYIGKGEATITDSSGKDKRVLHVTITGEKKKLTDCKSSLPQTSFVVTGSQIKARVLIRDGDELLENGTDYNITYENNIKVGKAIVTLTGKGDYTGSITLEYQIVPVETSISEVSISDKKITVAWNTIDDASGYEIYYASKKDGKYKKLADVTNASTYTTTKLTEGMYVKIRCYQTVNGKQYFSGYSQVQEL